jgi:hypothetical protein
MVTTMRGKMAENPIIPITLTTDEAALRHAGVTAKEIAKLCLRGVYLSKMHGGASRVPEKERRTAIFAKKVRKRWIIPASELDRLFLPVDCV